MAGQTVCRQSPEVGASCLNGHAGICAGGVGQPVSLPRPHINWMFTTEKARDKLAKAYPKPNASKPSIKESKSL